MYWPNQPSLQLNLEVAQLFIQTYHKFFSKVKNRSNHRLNIDILESSIKRKVFLYTLVELEVIILDIIELDLTSIDVQKLSSKILYDLISKITIKLYPHKSLKEQLLDLNAKYSYSKFYFYENHHLAKFLLIYLIFGSSNISNNIFKFNTNRTPVFHVKILFENFIIQISNIIVFNFLENNKNKKDLIFYYDKKYSLNNKSIRAVYNFQNNLFTYHLLNAYLHCPQDIYCGRYKTWLFSSKGLVYKYVSANRYLDYLKLPSRLIISIIYLELQDFIVPKINFLITLFGKLIIYITIEIMSKSIQIILHQIIIRVNKTKQPI